MKRIILCLFSTAAFLSLTAESCLLSTKQVEVPVRDSEQLLFHTKGQSQDSGDYSVDFKQALLDLEDSNEFDVLLAANLENAWWRVQENSGDGGLAVHGQVTVERLAAKPGVTGPAVVLPLLSYQTQSIDAALGTFRPVDLDSAGVTLVNSAFQEFLVARAQGLSGNDLPSVNFQFHWTATITGGGSPPNVDFTWEGKVKFSLVGLVTVDVPEL